MASISKTIGEISDEKPRKGQPFVVDAQAPMLKRNPRLSRNARNLYMTMRALADGKTGELKINGRWIKASVFDKAAEMCRNVRMPAMCELRDCGLVTMERERVARIINGRRRVVMGKTHYVVHRQAKPCAQVKNHQNAKDSSKAHLQKSIFCTVQEMDPQVLSNPPLGSAGSAGVDFELNIPKEQWERSSSVPAEDDFVAAARKTILASRSETPETVDAILAAIAERAAEAGGTPPQSARYFVKAFENQTAADAKALEAYGLVQGTKTPSGSWSYIAFVHGVVEQAARENRPAREVLTERLATCGTGTERR